MEGKLKAVKLAENKEVPEDPKIVLTIELPLSAVGVGTVGRWAALVGGQVNVEIESLQLPLPLGASR